jgi:hypothetical protein
LYRPNLQHCPHCSGTNAAREPACVLVSSHESSTEEVLAFINQAEELSFRRIWGQSYSRSCLGSNSVHLILATLAHPMSAQQEYSALLALRLCGFEVWGTIDNRHYYYRASDFTEFQTLERQEGEQVADGNRPQATQSPSNH